MQLALDLPRPCSPTYTWRRRAGSTRTTSADDELRGLAEAPRDARPRRERLAEVDTLARSWEAATGPERRAIVRELAASVAAAPGVVVPAWRS